MKLTQRATYRMGVLFVSLILLICLFGTGLTAKADSPEGASGIYSSSESQTTSSNTYKDEETSSETTSSQVEAEPALLETRSGTREINLSTETNFPVVISAADSNSTITITGSHTGEALSPVDGAGKPTDPAQDARACTPIIKVEYGFEGTIVLDNVTAVTLGNAPAMILDSEGQSGVNNSAPETKVKLIVTGTNLLHSGSLIFDPTKTEKEQLPSQTTSTPIQFAGLDVMTGTQVTIEGTGKLVAKSGTNNQEPQYTGAAGIGAGYMEDKFGTGGTQFSNTVARTNLGGNIFIKSDSLTVEAYGGYHGSGIGGGWSDNNINVIITEGNVTSIGGKHATGIGGGCDYNKDGSGNRGNGAKTYGTLVVIPPAEVTASGGNGKVGDVEGSSVYIGDKDITPSTVHTVDNTPNAPIYVNFTTQQDIVDGLILAGYKDPAITEDSLQVWNKWPIGITEANGIYNLHGIIASQTTFFTDVYSDDGYPYLPVETAVTSNIDIELPVANVKFEMSLAQTSVTDLLPGEKPEATTQGQDITIKFTGNMTIEEFSLALTGDNKDDFVITGYSALNNPSVESTTPPSKLKNGDYFVVHLLPKSGLGVGDYDDTKLEIKGKGTYGTGLAAKELELSGSKELLEQKVKKVTGVAYTHAQVVADIQPSDSWRNTAKVVLTPQVLPSTTSGLSLTDDAVETWSYIVTKTKHIAGYKPLTTDTRWVTGGTPTNKAAPSTYEFPDTADGTYYIYWKVETKYASEMIDMIATVENGNTVQTYKVDPIRPSVSSMSTTLSVVGIASFEVTVVFSEPVDAFTATQLVAENATITDIEAVSPDPVDNRTTKYILTVKADADLADETVIKIKVPENITDDKAGNLNYPSDRSSEGGANNDFTIKYSDKIPYVEYSFEDKKIFTTVPETQDIKVVIYSNGKGDKKLTYVSPTDGTNVGSEFASKYITVNGYPIDGSKYNASFDGSHVANGIYIYYITANDTFKDGDFEIKIADGKIENFEGFKLTESKHTFKVEVPVITGISSDPATLSSDGGTTTITITGDYLNNATSVVTQDGDGTDYSVTISEDGKSATVEITIPANTDYSNDVEYTYYPVLNGTKDSTLSATVTVGKKLSKIIFDLDGGDETTKPADISKAVDSAVDISAYMPGKNDEPGKFGYVFMGWIYQDGTAVPSNFKMPAGETTIKATWLDLSLTLVEDVEPYIVTVKNRETSSEIESRVGGRAEYRDANGVLHQLPIGYDWDKSVISQGGVMVIRPYVSDPKTKGKVYLNQVTYLYVLNPPYIAGGDFYVIFEGDTLSTDGSEFGVYAYGETVDLENHQIISQKLPLTFHGETIDTNTAGLYGAYFTTEFLDYFSNHHDLRHDVTLKVMKAAGLTKEEQKQVDSSYYWVKVAEIYHLAKDGEIWEVTPNNFMDGGRLLSTGNDFSNQPYNFLVNVEVGPYVYMNPVILDQIRTSGNGQMEATMEGRILIVNRNNFVTNPENLAPKGYFDLRMSAQENEKVTELVGLNRTQMQLHFEMNRAWLAEPFFSLKVNDSLQAAAEKGSALYLFNYNPSTNTLELVGNMTNQGNGYFGISMTGVYGDYVILADLPPAGTYRITDQTTTINNQAYSDISENLMDSGRVIPNEGLTGISTTKNIIQENFSIADIEEKSNSIAPIIIGGGIVVIVLGSIVGYLYKKKRKLD